MSEKEDRSKEITLFGFWAKDNDSFLDAIRNNPNQYRTFIPLFLTAFAGITALVWMSNT